MSDSNICFKGKMVIVHVVMTESWIWLYMWVAKYKEHQENHDFEGNYYSLGSDTSNIIFPKKTQCPSVPGHFRKVTLHTESFIALHIVYSVFLSEYLML